MITIYKYPLKPLTEQVIDIPEGSELLTIQNQNETPCMWAVVDPHKPLKKLVIKMIGTGHEITEPLPEYYLGTCQFGNDLIVFHFFTTNPSNSKT